MLGLTTYLELTLFIDLIASACYGLIFLLIKIPRSEYSDNLYWSKLYIALSYGIALVIFWFILFHRDMENFAHFATLMILVNTAVSAAVLSYSLISLLDDKFMSRDSFSLNVIAVAVLGTALARVALNGYEKATTILTIIFIAVHVIQCVYHILRFGKIYTISRRKFEEYYDEDGERRLRWIRFCYIIMMLSDMFFLIYVLFYFIFGYDYIIVIYLLFYGLFMLYFSSNYISFLSSHKVIMDAFAHETLDLGSKSEDARKAKREKKLSLLRLKEKQDENERKAAEAEAQAPVVDEAAYGISDEFREREFKRIAKALDRWVAEKRYREYDKSRDEIAEDLRTSKEMLQLYFSVRVGEDFRTWRTELRIEDAKKLLLEDKRASTNMVAEISGFSDRSNFHRQFTKIVGCSPKEWRETDGHPEKLK